MGLNSGTIVTTETKKTINNNLHYTMHTTIHEHQLHQTLRENPGTIVTTETKKTINNNLHYTMQTPIHEHQLHRWCSCIGVCIV
jgi:flagellar basal body rod protein FlgB